MLNVSRALINRSVTRVRDALGEEGNVAGSITASYSYFSNNVSQYGPLQHLEKLTARLDFSVPQI